MYFEDLCFKTNLEDHPPNCLRILNFFEIFCRLGLQGMSVCNYLVTTWTPPDLFTPMCVWGLPMYLVKALSRDKGKGRYTMYLPFSPYRFLGAYLPDPLSRERAFTKYMGNP